MTQRTHMKQVRMFETHHIKDKDGKILQSIIDGSKRREGGTLPPIPNQPMLSEKTLLERAAKEKIKAMGGIFISISIRNKKLKYIDADGKVQKIKLVW